MLDLKGMDTCWLDTAQTQDYHATVEVLTDHFWDLVIANVYLSGTILYVFIKHTP